MWVYMEQWLPDKFIVGYFRPDGEFMDIKEVDDEIKAQLLVNYLNGGSGK